jgi:alkyl hydroperoxide reductase subunit AhpF
MSRVASSSMAAAGQTFRFFAAGDVTSNYAEQVLIAVGEGAKAALSACDYLLQT